MPHPFHSSRFHHTHNSGWGVQIMKFSPLSCYLAPLRPKYMTNVSEKICRKPKHIMFNNYFYGNRADYEIMCKNIAEKETPQMTI
jgi:hypothetical protein